MVGPVRFLDQIDRDAPPRTQRTEHPEVACSLHAIRNATLESVIRRRALDGSPGIAIVNRPVVCEEAARDGRADGEREEANRKDDVTGGGCKCAAPRENGQDDEP